MKFSSSVQGWYASSGSATQQLFGLGIVQDERVNGRETLPIDNQFMALALHVGYIGLIVFLNLFWSFWRMILKQAIKTKAPLPIAVTSLWASFLAISLFDISTVPFVIGLMLVLMTTEPQMSKVIFAQTS